MARAEEMRPGANGRMACHDVVMGGDACLDVRGEGKASMIMVDSMRSAFETRQPAPRDDLSHTAASGA